MVSALFKWYGRATGSVVDAATLGTSTVALPLSSGCVVPDGCTGVVFDAGGSSRRQAEGSRITLREQQRACCFHPGPYALDLTPFPGAPEVGLRLRLVIDSPDPRVNQQRFDLYLMSEADGRLELATLGRAIDDALQLELRQGHLDLPPCTTLGEWTAFRAGFNQLLYTRFGVTVEDCVPADLADTVDFAQQLRERAAQGAVQAPAQAPSRPPVPASSQPPVQAASQPPVQASSQPPAQASSQPPVQASSQPPVQASSQAPAAPVPHAPPPDARCEPSLTPMPAAAPSIADQFAACDAEPTPENDARALRRLFLELPGVMCGWRLALLPPGPELFQLHQSLLARLDMVNLGVSTMPSLAWFAPGQPLDADSQARRAMHSLRAARALDEAWALLARMKDAADAQLPLLLDDADRIVANLERDTAARRAARQAREEPV